MSAIRPGQPARHLARLILFAGATLAGRAAAGVVICVDNDTTLGNVIQQASYLPVTIELVQGTYHVSNTNFDPKCQYYCDPYVQVVSGFSLLGGYTANCASRQVDPANTVIAEDVPQAGFRINASGDVTIEGLTIAGVLDGLTVAWDEGIQGTVQDNVNALIRRVVVDGLGFDGGITLEWFPESNDKTLSARLVDSLLHDNASVGCLVWLDTIDGYDPAFTLVNNTIVGNDQGDGDTICVGFPGYLSGGGRLLAYNNIVYGNSGYDLVTYLGTSAVLVDNVIGSHSYQGAVTASGTLTGDPKLDAGYRPIESPASPVINSGSNQVPGGLPSHDLDGGPRVVGTTVDRGAYESSIDDAYLQTVSNTNDSGTGSLRTAISSANANGSTGALITFDIGTGCGPHVITLASPLPDITVPVIINGFTQPGASPNDLDVGNDAVVCIVLDGGSSGMAPDHAIGTASDAPAGTQVTIRGLAIGGFPRAIDLQGGSGHEVAGNHFGGKVSGYSLEPNGTAIRLGTATHDVIVGGDDPASRNLVGAGLDNGIVMQGGVVNAIAIGSNNDQILNNYVGVGWSLANGAYTERGNAGPGIRLAGHDNVVSGNLIGTNVGAGILVIGGAAAGNLIAGNFIGADADGQSVGNIGDGVRVAGSSGNAPHGNIVRNNAIANNNQAGVGVEIGQGNKIRKNSIYANAQLGIDLAAAGVTANDDDGGLQLADLANHALNFPVLGAAIGGTNRGTVSGTLTTLPGDYTIDIYAGSACDGSGYGEGQIWLRGVSVTVPTPMLGDQGTATFNARISLPLLGGRTITATATDAAGDTSEFSACITYFDDTIFANGFEPPPA